MPSSELKRILGKGKGKLVLEVTHKCNSLCPCCCAASYSGNLPSMSLDTAKKSIDQAVGSGIEFLLITGGEPTLADVLPDIVEYGSSRRMEVRVNTNGWKSDRAYWRMLAEKGLDYAGLSMDSSHNSQEMNRKPILLKKAVKTLQNMIHCGIETLVPITPFPGRTNPEKGYLETLRMAYEDVARECGEKCCLQEGDRFIEFTAGDKFNYAVITKPLSYDGRKAKIISRNPGKCPERIDLKENFFIRVSPEGKIRAPCNSDQYMRMSARSPEDLGGDITNIMKLLRKNRRFGDFLKNGIKGHGDACYYCMGNFLNSKTNLYKPSN